MSVIPEADADESTAAIESTIVSYARFQEVRQRRMRVMAALSRQQPAAASREAACALGFEREQALLVTPTRVE